MFLSFKCFRTSGNCHFRLLLGGFFIRTAQKQPTFLTGDDKQDDVSDMLQFFEVLRYGRNWAKKLTFLLILSQTFFVLIQQPWNAPSFGIFGPLLSHILFDLAETMTRGSLQ